MRFLQFAVSTCSGDVKDGVFLGSNAKRFVENQTFRRNQKSVLLA
jgi:hypothetical protein